MKQTILTIIMLIIPSICYGNHPAGWADDGKSARIICLLLGVVASLPILDKKEIPVGARVVLSIIVLLICYFILPYLFLFILIFLQL